MVILSGLLSKVYATFSVLIGRAQSRTNDETSPVVLFEFTYILCLKKGCYHFVFSIKSRGVKTAHFRNATNHIAFMWLLGAREKGVWRRGDIEDNIADKYDNEGRQEESVQQ